MGGSLATVEAAIETLAGLVAVPTVPGQANAQMLSHVLQGLAPQDVRVHRVPSPLGDVDGLVLSAGPNVPGGMILSAHLDVVSVEGQAWQGDPFKLRRDGDRLYGRGTCDMKGFAACALTALRNYPAQTAQTPLHVVLSGDEETTCRSVESLVQTALDHLPPVRGVLVGEPSSLQPVDRHKASATHRVEVTGRAIHACRAHAGVDAIAIAARLIAWLSDETARNAAEPGNWGFDPDYVLHTVAQITGGNSVNTVADHCAFDWDIRLVPDIAMAEITDRFDTYARHLVDGSAAVTRTCTAWFPGLNPDPGSAFGANLAKACAMDSFLGMPFGTEAGFFQEAGYETFICGPGDISNAHIADEHVTANDLAGCLKLIKALS